MSLTCRYDRAAYRNRTDDLRIREARSLAVHALAAPMARTIALTAPAALGLSKDPFHMHGARGRTAVAENHRDGDQSDGGEKPGQDRGSLQAATAVRRFSAAPARAAAVRRVAQR